MSHLFQFRIVSFAVAGFHKASTYSTNSKFSYSTAEICINYYLRFCAGWRRERRNEVEKISSDCCRLEANIINKSRERIFIRKCKAKIKTTGNLREMLILFTNGAKITCKRGRREGGERQSIICVIRIHLNRIFSTQHAAAYPQEASLASQVHENVSQRSSARG